MNGCATIKAKAKIPILSRYADLKEWRGEDYGPVTCEELSTLRRNSVILFESELHPGKISEWTLRTDPSREIKYYICVLCRRLQDKGRREVLIEIIQDKGRREVPPIQFGKAARIVVRNGRFLTHPDHPTIPHICGFDENPMSDRCSVLSRRAMLRARTEISEDGSTAQQKIDEIIARFRSDPKYAHLSDEELMNIERIVRSGRTALNMSSSLSMSRARLKSKAKSACLENGSKTKPRRVYECPIVGCSFITHVTAMLDVHICEKHKTADDPSQQNQNVRFNDCDNDSVSGGLNEQQGASSSSLSKRHYSLVFFRSRTNAGKISEWSKDGLRGDASTHYSCVLCRKLRSKTNRNNNPSAELGRAAGIVIRNGRFIIDPDNPNPPHICNFDNNPLSDEVEVLKRRSQLLRRDYIKAKRQAKDKRKVMGGGMFFVNTVESEDDEEQQVAAEYGIATTSTSEAFDHCSLSYPNSYAAEDCSARLYPNENLHGNIVFEIKSNRDGITKSITKQIEVCEDGANDPTENYSNDSDPKYECSIVGCNFRTSELQQLNNHLIDHESLDEIDNLDHIQQEIIISAECSDNNEMQSHCEMFRNGILSPYPSSSQNIISPTSHSSVPSDQIPNKRFISSTGGVNPECSHSFSKDFGSVVYEAFWDSDGNNENSNQSSPIVLFESVRYPGRISEWMLSESTNNHWYDRTTRPDELKYYTCILCEERRIERMTQTDSVDDIDSRPYPSAQIIVCNSRFLTHPDYPLGEHSCEFEINEMSLPESVLKQRPYVVRERYHERNDAYQSAQAVSLSLPSSPSKMLVISPSSEHHQSPSTSQRTTANALLLSNMDGNTDESVISNERAHDLIASNLHTIAQVESGRCEKTSVSEHQFYLNIESNTNFMQSPPNKKRRSFDQEGLVML